MLDSDENCKFFTYVFILTFESYVNHQIVLNDQYACWGIQIKNSLNLILSVGFSTRLLHLNNNYIKIIQFLQRTKAKEFYNTKILMVKKLDKLLCILLCTFEKHSQFKSYGSWNF